MKKVGLIAVAVAVLTIGCKDKEVIAPVVEDTQVNVIQETVETKELKLSGETMDTYMDSENVMMISLVEKDQLRLQKAIQIIGNMNIFYTEDEGIDNDKTDAAFLKIVGGKTFKQVCAVAEGYLKAEQKQELDRIHNLLGTIKDPKAASEVDRYNEAQQNLKEANQMPITLDDYTYNEECFL